MPSLNNSHNKSTAGEEMEREKGVGCVVVEEGGRACMRDSSFLSKMEVGKTEGEWKDMEVRRNQKKGKRRDINIQEDFYSISEFACFFFPPLSAFFYYPHYKLTPGQFLARHCLGKHWGMCIESWHRISGGKAVFNVIPMQYKSALFHLDEHRQEAWLYLGDGLPPLIKPSAQQLTF